MIQTWQLQEAKNKLSRVVENAVNSGPQIITKHGVEVAIVLSYTDYQKIVASRGKLSAFFPGVAPGRRRAGSHQGQERCPERA